MRALVAILAVVLAAGCARGITHSMEAVESAEVTLAGDASAEVVEGSGGEASAIDASAVDAEPTSCEATRTDEACFDCCDAKFPKAIDIWFDALDACCPNDECEDEAYEKCELAADDLCAKTAECAGLEACEDRSGCWEKISSEP